MKSRIFLTLVLYLILVSCNATTYYVATNGDDAYNGTSKSTPFKTVTKAINVAGNGDIIYIRSGNYTLTYTVTISKSGADGNPITLMGYPDEAQPVLDFSTQTFGNRGIQLSGNYWYIKGIKVKGAGDNGLYISGSYNKVEFCSFFENRDTGLQLSGGASNNQIINCDSYYNADPTDYGDADGFAVKMDVGSGNYFYGCRAWLNCDDGWDGYMRGADDVTTTLENCWTSWNGYFKDGTDAGAAANGNGFKMGGSDDKTLKHNFILKNCLAYNNKDKNFDQNNNKGSMTLYNCTAFGGSRNYVISQAVATGKTVTVKNCVSLNGSVDLGTFVVQQTNSWLSAFTTNEDDFINIDTSQTYQPRKADGSLPDLTFMHLVDGSDLIDAGTDVGISFHGTKPDLGCFESGVEITSFKFIESNKNTLKIFPTLTDGQLFIEPLDNSTLSYVVEVFSINGKIQRKYKIANFENNKMVLNVINLPSGLYFCRIISPQNSAIGKFVKK